jgi:hypothetical protein
VKLSPEAEVLTKALALLDGGRCWTKGVAARDRRGAPVPAGHCAAIVWCSAGAILRILGGDSHGTMYLKSFELLRLGSRMRDPVNTNDTAPDFKAVNEMFLDAIRIGTLK